MSRKDYVRAEQAFNDALAVADQGANPPSQKRWIYNNQTWLHQRTRNKKLEQEAELKAAEYNRILD